MHFSGTPSIRNKNKRIMKSLSSSSISSQETDESTATSASEESKDDEGRAKSAEAQLPIKKFKFDHEKTHAAPFIIKLAEGMYFNECVCRRIFYSFIYEKFGCMCALIMHGVEDNPDFRFFKGAFTVKKQKNPLKWRSL